MRYYGLSSFFFLLVLAVAMTQACGSPASHISPNCKSAPTASNDSMPESITLCPAVADTQDYPNGQVQFIAIGSFQTSPSPALLKPQLWGACQDNSPTTVVSISNLGLAQCESGASGTYSVFASDMTNCLAISPCGTGCFVSGYGELTCP
jgi:hypothetical protein